MPTAAVPQPVAQPPAAKPQLRKFTAPTMQACLANVRKTLGPTAVVLNTKQIHHKRFFGLLRRESIEITAGTNITPANRRPKTPPTPQQQMRQAQAPGFNRQLLDTPAGHAAAYLGVQQDIGEIKKIVANLQGDFNRHAHGDVPAAWHKAYRRLRDQGLSRGLARKLTYAAGDALPPGKVKCEASLATQLRKEVRRRLPVAGPIPKTGEAGPPVVALIGPTGVGKTTTVAKLAAQLGVVENHKVGLITIDTYRIAAVDQLKKYAEILEVPLHVVNTPAEIGEAVKKLADCDYVLIDTAGRAPTDAAKLAELKAFLHAASPSEVHLVLSATTDKNATATALQRFAGVRADRLIFTKLDETERHGLVLEVAAGEFAERAGRPLPMSYVTAGQAVPDDIEAADAEKLAARIVND